MHPVGDLVCRLSALLNGAFLESENAGVPRSNDEIAELMIFLDHDRVSGMPTGLQSGPHPGAAQHRDDRCAAQTLDRIRALSTKISTPGWRRITGDSTLTLSATDSMIMGQLQSVLMILTLFVLIVSFLFTGPARGTAGRTTQHLSDHCPVRRHGLCRHPAEHRQHHHGGGDRDGHRSRRHPAFHAALQPGTAHFKSQALAMQKTIYERPCRWSHLGGLTVGFLVFAQSDFTPVAQFGLLSALVISTAWWPTVITAGDVAAATGHLWDLLSSRLRHRIIPRSRCFLGCARGRIRKFVLSSTLARIQRQRLCLPQRTTTTTRCTW